MSDRSQSGSEGDENEEWRTDSSSGGSSIEGLQPGLERGEDVEDNSKKATAQALYLWYNLLTQHLMRQTPAHPALPHEVVRDISRLSQLTMPMTEVIMKNEIVAHARDQQPIRRLWFESEPFISRLAIDRLATVKLSTNCQHQGWVSMPDHGSWSWFEVAILVEAGRDMSSQPGLTGNNSKNSGMERVKISADGRPLRWISHKIPVPQRKATNLEGLLFEGDHELFSNLEVGDSIGVFAYAQFGGWQCKGMEGKLALEAFFEPLPLIC